MRLSCGDIMDAVELNYPVDVVAPNLVGSEGFGRDRVTVKEVEACKSTRFSALVSSRASIERCSSLPSEKGDFFSLIFISIF